MQAISDTIVAIGSGSGRAGIAVVRLSGPEALQILENLCGDLPAPREARLRHARDADHETLDVGLALSFPGPSSYTGEDVAEFHGHGGAVLARLVIDRCVALGARRAGPGEFSQRAFLNGRMDLAQAEAIADAINAGSEAAARAAMRSLEGRFSATVDALVNEITELRMYVEAAIDFPDEDIDLLTDRGLSERLARVEERFTDFEKRLAVGRVLTDGLTIALLGAPNAGKSSLLNALVGYESAIVTDIPGTTRDVLREQLDIDGLPVTLIDTAGLRDAGDAIEKAGIARAREVAARVDHALLIVDGASAGNRKSVDQQAASLAAELPADTRATLVINKIDLVADPDAVLVPNAQAVSAKTGAGISALVRHLHSVAGVADADAGTFSARRRHTDAVAEARTAFERGRAELRERAAGELLADELRVAQDALGSITGHVSSDDLLGHIFSSFCIGK